MTLPSTNHGRACAVEIEECQQVTGAGRSIVDALAMPGLAEIEIDFPRSREIPKGVNLECPRHDPRNP